MLKSSLQNILQLSYGEPLSLRVRRPCYYVSDRGRGTVTFRLGSSRNLGEERLRDEARSVWEEGKKREAVMKRGD